VSAGVIIAVVQRRSSRRHAQQFPDTDEAEVGQVVRLYADGDGTYRNLIVCPLVNLGLKAMPSG
jgi:hypothetical protein